MLDLGIRKMVDSQASAAPSLIDEDAGPAQIALGGPAAATAHPNAAAVGAAWSPIVVAGIVRLAEFLLIITVGVAVYLGYLVPIEGFAWRYVGAIFGVAVLAMLAFQCADIYQVQAFRGYEKQYFRLASAWSVVFLLTITATFFAKAGDHYSRIWLGAFYVVGLIVLLGFRRTVFLLVRHWTRQGRLDRRTVIVGADQRGDALISALAAQGDSDVRVLGVVDDRAHDRDMPARREKLGTVDDLLTLARKTVSTSSSSPSRSRPRAASWKC
jgi:FlaA1/EpsC-like NDP-sugar epimerase